MPPEAVALLDQSVAAMLLSREGILFPPQDKGNVVNLWNRPLVTYKAPLTSTKTEAQLSSYLHSKMGTFPADYNPQDGAGNVLSQSLMDRLSLEVTNNGNPRRIFMSLFSPYPIDVGAMSNLCERDWITTGGTTGDRKDVARKYTLGDASPSTTSKPIYHVLWGVVTCGLHTVLRSPTYNDE
jgi:hypothetical protein